VADADATQVVQLSLHADAKSQDLADVPQNRHVAAKLPFLHATVAAAAASQSPSVS
jgi:hypothetical protein